MVTQTLPCGEKPPRPPASLVCKFGENSTARLGGLVEAFISRGTGDS
jgi:hypothetical protein